MNFHKLLFKQWFLNEVTFSGGKYGGKDHFNVPTDYLLYLALKFSDGKNINYYSIEDIEDILNEIIRRKNSGRVQRITVPDQQRFFDDFDPAMFDTIMNKVKAVKSTSRPEPPATTFTRPAPVVSSAPIPDSREWFLAKVIEDYAGMTKGTFVAVSKSMVDPTNFEYIKVDDPSISGMITLTNAKKHFASERKENGEVIKINKPEEGVIDPSIRLKTAMSKHTKDKITEEEKANKYILTNLDKPENREQKAIDERFAQILRTGEKSHVLLNALAGSGKTTILNHLAWKYGAPGQKWLYLVFNKKNRYEASTKFPSWVDVQTTNSFLGSKVLDLVANKKIVGGTEIATRVSGKKDIEKLTMLADTVACSNLVKSLNLPDIKLAKPKEMTYRSYGRATTKSYPTDGFVKKYLNAIKSDAVKMAEIAKAYSLDPRDTDCETKLREIMTRNFWAHQRRTTTMKGFLDRGSFYEQVIKAGLIDSRPEKISGSEWENNDKEATYKIAMWLLKNSLPNQKLEDIDIGGRKVNLGSLRDFTDDLWFTSLYANEISWPKYDVVLADEVQDFSESQKIMLKKLADQGAIVVAVGDPSQCHPAGTVISLTGGKDKPIEEIKVGDMVVSYNSKKSYFPGTKTQGRKVEEISCRNYSGELIKLSSNNYSHECTPNHKCFVKLACKNKYCLYLMKKGDCFRVGVCKTNYKDGFGLTTRSTQEQADKSWLLNIFDTEESARIHENFVASKFGLPQIIFTNRGQKSPNQTVINETYKLIGNNFENAINCLKYFGREYDYPIWENKEKNNFIGFNKSFVTQACNLISGEFAVRTYDDCNRGGRWEKINVERRKTNCKVYSLKVQAAEDGRRLYIANNIVTHNSIYKFRGADHLAFNNLKEMLSSISKDRNVEKTLTRNFRSKKAILDFVNSSTTVNNLKVGKKYDPSEEGEVTTTKYNTKDSMELISNERIANKANPKNKILQTAYISRNGLPLSSIAAKLMERGIPYVMFGYDAVDDVKKAIYKYCGVKEKGKDKETSDGKEKISSIPIENLPDLMNEYYNKVNERYAGKAAANKVLEEERKTSSLITSTIEAFKKSTGYEQTVGGYLKWTQNICGGINLDDMSEQEKEKLDSKLEDKGVVVLTTAHRSKGFEFDRVFILNPGMFGAKILKRDPEISDEAHESDNIQEENMKYVAYTRAIDQLHLMGKKEEDENEEKKSRMEDEEISKDGDGVDIDLL